MKQNIGKTDRAIRLIVALVAFVLFFSGAATGVFGYICVAVGVILVVTAAFSFCPVYSILGTNTCNVNTKLLP